MRTDGSLSERLLAMALDKGATMAEVYQCASRNISADARADAADAVQSSRVFGYSLRVIKEGRLGFSYSTDRNELERTAGAAMEMADFTGRDEFLGLPHESAASYKPDVYDPAVESIKEGDAIELACLMERSAFETDRRVVKTRKSSASFSVRDIHVMNTHGVSCGFLCTSCSGSIMSVAEEDDDSRMGWDFQSGRFLSDVSFTSIGRTSAGRALSLLGARRIDSTLAPVILDSSVAAGFVSVFSAMLSSEAVQKNRSLLKDRVGDRVISGIVSLLDDGTMPHGPGSRHVDDEGVPVSRKYLIDKGVLCGFMHNTHTANREKAMSTGNAVRRGLSSLPSIGPINLFIAPSGKTSTFSKMTGAMDRGLYVTEAMGMHTANPVSGDFSVGVSGMWIDRGRIMYPVREAVISGNLLDFFGMVEALGDDLRFYGRIGSPSLLFGPTDISA
jgi:PmbA protein